jgi:hypothetical protein
MTELRSFTRQHLEGTLALFTTEDLLAVVGGFYLGLGTRQVPGFRLTRECLGLDGNAGPATHGLRGNYRAATDGGL